jgi:hypothetical protein
MGYAGYVSAKYPPPKPSEAEAALMQVKSEAALEIIGKLLYNAAIAPREEKYRCAPGSPCRGETVGLGPSWFRPSAPRRWEAPAGRAGSACAPLFVPCPPPHAVCAMPARRRPPPHGQPPMSVQPTVSPHPHPLPRFSSPPNSRIKLTNPKIREAVVEATGGIESLRALGWVEDPEAPEEFLVVPPGLYFSMKEVRMVEAQKERLQKEARRNSSKNLAGMVSVQA